MADTVTARQGDTLDALIWRDRGLGGDDLGRVVAINPGLADLGAVLPIGTVVTLPAQQAPTARALPLVNLWD